MVSLEKAREQKNAEKLQAAYKSMEDIRFKKIPKCKKLFCWKEGEYVVVTKLGNIGKGKKKLDLRVCYCKPDFERFIRIVPFNAFEFGRIIKK